MNCSFARTYIFDHTRQLLHKWAASRYYGLFHTSFLVICLAFIFSNFLVADTKEFVLWRNSTPMTDQSVLTLLSLFLILYSQQSHYLILNNKLSCPQQPTAGEYIFTHKKMNCLGHRFLSPGSDHISWFQPNFVISTTFHDFKNNKVVNPTQFL